MKRLLRLGLAVLVVLAAGALQAQAGCPGCGCGGYGDGWNGGGRWPNGCGIGGFDAYAFIAVPPNRANIFPNHGFTFYDGMWATGFQAVSNYAPINYVLPPAGSAESVLVKLREMNIPLVSPEPMFLNKNPRIAENVRLPAPVLKKAKKIE